MSALKLAGCEVHYDVGSPAWGKLLAWIDGVNARGWTASVETSIHALADYYHALEPRIQAGLVRLSCKPSGGKFDAAGLSAYGAALRQFVGAIGPDKAAGLTLLHDFEGFFREADFWTQGADGAAWDAFAQLIHLLRVRKMISIWYPFLCGWSSDDPVGRMQRMTQLCGFTSALDRGARFVDSKLCRSDERYGGLGGRFHSSWSVDVQGLSNYLERAPLHHACPNSPAWGDSWWPRERLPELLAACDEWNEELFFFVPETELLDWAVNIPLVNGAGGVAPVTAAAIPGATS